MPKQSVIQTFTKGMDSDKSPFILDLSQCALLENMLLERGMLVSRPGLLQVASAVSVNDFLYWVGFSNPNPINFASYGYLFHLVDTLAGGVTFRAVRNTSNFMLLEDNPALAGPALTVADSNNFFMPQLAVFNGAAVIAGCNEGLVRYLSGPNYTLAHNVPYRCVVTHKSRVLAANNRSGNPNQLAWSKIGDETVWSGVYDAGSLLLQESDDGITGLVVLRDLVVVIRNYGFHIGTPTGNAGNPYNWLCISRDDVGCTYPGTVAKYGDKCFFASDTDIHTFDLSRVESIGEGISTELFEYVQTYNCSLRGVVTRSYKPGRRPQYHIMPTFMPRDVFHKGISAISAPFPHYVYDILEGVWSKHSYLDTSADTWPPFLFNLPFLQHNATLDNYLPQNTVGLMRRGAANSYQYWSPTGFTNQSRCESQQAIRTGRIQIGSPDKEVQTLRITMVARFNIAAEGSPVALTVSSYLGNTKTNTAASSNPTIPAGDNWVRIRWDNIKVGQFFELMFSFAVNVKVQVRQVLIEHEAQEQELRIVGGVV